MTYELYIGDRTFSSWSLRGWLMLEKFGLPFSTVNVGLYSGTMGQDLAHLAPARTVPVLRTSEGHLLTDSLAMAETLAERHPERGLYPSDPAARALCRSLVAEMHSGFAALRRECPMIVSHVSDGFEPSAAVLADLDRIAVLWRLARARHSKAGGFLFGEYSLADVFYAPVAMRIIGYKLPIAADVADYVTLHNADPAIRDWRKAAGAEEYDPWPYDTTLRRAPWPDAPDELVN